MEVVVMAKQYTAKVFSSQITNAGRKEGTVINISFDPSSDFFTHDIVLVGKHTLAPQECVVCMSRDLDDPRTYVKWVKIGTRKHRVI